MLTRWLTPFLVDKSRSFKNLGKVNRGVFQGSILSSSIANLLLSNAFPENILKKKRKDRQIVWANIFSYADEIILISNNPAAFFRQLIQLKKNFKKIGLSFNEIKTKSFVCIKSKIKFQFLGFEFSVVPRDQLKKSPLLFNMKNLHSLKKSIKGFGILLRPSLERVKDIKKQLKAIIKRILHQPRQKIYKSFQIINYVLLD